MDEYIVQDKGIRDITFILLDNQIFHLINLMSNIHNYNIFISSFRVTKSSP